MCVSIYILPSILIFLQLYGIKNSYLIQIFSKQVYLTPTWDPITYFLLVWEYLQRRATQYYPEL